MLRGVRFLHSDCKASPGPWKHGKCPRRWVRRGHRLGAAAARRQAEAGVPPARVGGSSSPPQIEDKPNGKRRKAMATANFTRRRGRGGVRGFAQRFETMPRKPRPAERRRDLPHSGSPCRAEPPLNLSSWRLVPGATRKSNAGTETARHCTRLRPTLSPVACTARLALSWQLAR